MSRSPALTELAGSAEAPTAMQDTHLLGRRRRIALAGWAVQATLAIAFVLASARASITFWTRLPGSCPDPVVIPWCADWSRNLIAAYGNLGLSLGAVMTAGMVAQLTVTAVLWGLAGLIVWQRSDNSMALLVALLLVTVDLPTFGLAWSWALLGSNWQILGYVMAELGWVVLLLVVARFPTGKFTPRWSGWVVLLDGVLAVPCWVLLTTSLGPFPIWIEPLVWLWIASAGGLFFAQVYRYRQTVDPVRRQQIKWVISGLCLSLLLVVAQYVPPLMVPSLRQGDTYVLYSVASELPAIISTLVVPCCVAMAILRYRLWDIDRLINRTLVYGALTASVVAFYILLVDGLGSLLQARGSALVALVATGLIAVFVQPLRAYLQRGVNHLLYGERHEPYRVLTHLGQRLEGTLSPDAVLPTIVETVAHALKLPYVALAVQQDGTPALVAVSGPPGIPTLMLPLVYRGEHVGQLLLSPRAPGETFTPDEQRLLADLARQASVAVHTVRLHTQALQLGADLQQARERLVSAREEERRRLRRDLHDGLGPQLASQTLTLDAARKLLRRDPATAELLLAAASAHAQDAIVDIRRLVYDLRPPALDELGLVGALRTQETQLAPTGLRLTLDAPARLPPLPAAVEVACYRIVQEALTNVARHAHAHTCTVRLFLCEGEAAPTETGHALCVEIGDDGLGLPSAPSAGVGLRSMRERAEELGGHCRIVSSPHQGTRVSARLPLPRDSEALGP